MSVYTERKAALDKDPKAKKNWQIVLGLVIIGAIWGVVQSLLADKPTLDNAQQQAFYNAAFSGGLMVALIFSFLFFVFIFRLHRWVIFLMWLGVLFSLIGMLMGFSLLGLISLALSLAQTLLYQMVLNKIKHVTGPGSPATPPPAPAA